MREFELAWAPFYCFGEPIHGFRVAEGSISCAITLLAEQNDQETKFPSSLFLDDTPNNERLVAILNQMLHLGFPCKALHQNNNLYLLFGSPTWTDDMMEECDTINDKKIKDEKQLQTALKLEMSKSQMIVSNHGRNRRSELRSNMYAKMKRLRTVMEQHGIHEWEMEYDG